MKYDLIMVDDVIHIFKTFEENGPIIKCYPNGLIELYEVLGYGNEELFIGYHDNLYSAIKEAETLL